MTSSALATEWSARWAFAPRIVFATGGRTAEENEGALQAMKDQEAHIPIATTVVETGVNLPFLRHVLIVNADRLGAVQLHQLRGRLVRTGGHGSLTCTCPIHLPHHPQANGDPDYPHAGI